MQTCENCGHDYNEFTSGTPASENLCDDCDPRPYLHSNKFANRLTQYENKKLARNIGGCPKCGSRDLEGWIAGGQEGFTCASCGHDQTTKIDDTTYHRKHPDKNFNRKRGS